MIPNLISSRVAGWGSGHGSPGGCITMLGCGGDRRPVVSGLVVVVDRGWGGGMVRDVYDLGIYDLTVDLHHGDVIFGGVPHRLYTHQTNSTCSATCARIMNVPLIPS